MTKLNKLGYESLLHPPYSLNLAPSNYCLLINLKTWLSGRRFSSNVKIISQTNVHFEELNKYFCLGGGAYSLESAPNDCFLFMNLEKWLSLRWFNSNNFIIAQTNTHFEDFIKSYNQEGDKKFENRWTNCVELKGDLIEK